MFVLINFPKWFQRTYRFYDPSEIPEDIRSFHAIITHRLSFDKFSEFCLQEFNLENVLFFEEIEMYRERISRMIDSNTSEEELYNYADEHASNIVDKYIDEEGALQVNLPAHARDAIYAKLYGAPSGDEDSQSRSRNSRHNSGNYLEETMFNRSSTKDLANELSRIRETMFQGRVCISLFFF